MSFVYKKTHNKPLFLALTALEDFWDTKKPIWYLGTWCLKYSKSSSFKKATRKVIDSPFSDTERLKEAYQFVNKTYEKTLPLLSETLNDIHGTRHTPRYWRIVIGPWLYSYLSVMYDRYMCLKEAMEIFPDFETIGLSEESFTTPSDTLDFIFKLREDVYNIQLYSKILIFFGKTFPTKKKRTSKNPLQAQMLAQTWRHKIVGYITTAYTNAGAKIFQSIVLRSAYFPKKYELLILIKNFGKILPVVGSLNKQSTFKKSTSFRRKLQHIKIGDSEFETVLSEMIHADIPKCYLEGFEHTNKHALNVYPNKIKAILSANGWYYDESFKFWAAASCEKGSILLGTQHGGNYGGLAYMAFENHETSITDYYYTWGWKRSNCVSKTIPLPASKMIGRRIMGASNKKTGILWGGTVSPRYQLQFPYSPHQFEEYLSWQCRFAKTLSNEILTEIRFRPHREDSGWDIIKRLNDCVSKITIESWKVPFLESLENCRVYICDHMSTTFSEALAANKPTVLFWDPQVNELRPEAQSYYDLLRSNGILFDTPEKAAENLNYIYKDIESWWNIPERQAAVKKFCEQFAHTSPDAEKIWNSEFKRILDITDSN